MKKYIVIWFMRKDYIGKRYGNEKLFEKDEYRVFIDGRSSEDNIRDATAFYNNKKDEDHVYSCNLCEIIDSTDYFD